LSAEHPKNPDHDNIIPLFGPRKTSSPEIEEPKDHTKLEVQAILDLIDPSLILLNAGQKLLDNNTSDALTLLTYLCLNKYNPEAEIYRLYFSINGGVNSIENRQSVERIKEYIVLVQKRPEKIVLKNLLEDIVKITNG